MSNILAVFGTSYGQTEKITRRIASRLSREGLSVTTMRGNDIASTARLDEYDGFIIAASVLVGHHQRYIEDFVRRERSRLNAVPSAFISVSASAGSPSPENQAAARGYVEKLFRVTGWRAAATATFGGCTAFTKYGFFLRWIMLLISRRKGGPTDVSRDHESTDWEAVDRFAAELASAFSVTAAGKVS